MKKVKCPNCHGEKEVSDDIIMSICYVCQEEMEECREVIENE